MYDESALASGAAEMMPKAESQTDRILQELEKSQAESSMLVESVRKALLKVTKPVLNEAAADGAKSARPSMETQLLESLESRRLKQNNINHELRKLLNNIVL